MKLPKLLKSETFLPMSAVVAFVALIGILFLIKKSGRTPYVGYSSAIARMTAAQRLAYINSFRGTRPVRPVRPVRPMRTVPSRALIGMGQWHRRWDQMSGSSTYSRDSLKGGHRPMLHMA